jgi:phage shock protein E
MKFNRLAVLTLMVSFSALSACSQSAELTKDSLETVQKKIADEKAILVDVREKKEWDEGHVEGAVFLPLSKLQAGVDAKTLAKQLPKEKIIYTHCVVGKRAVTAGKILEKLGYEVRPLKPGYKEMVKAGFKKAEEPKPK